MKAIRFPEANVTLTRPEDQKDDRFTPPEAYMGTLPVGGRVFFTTLWQPSQADLEAMIDGRPIVLQLICDKIPPLAMFTTHPEGSPLVEKEDEHQNKNDETNENNDKD